MAYDRHDSRRGPREQSRTPNDPYRGGEGRERDGRGEPGFFERAGEHIASWFGDEEDDERDRRHDQMRPTEREYRPESGGRYGGQPEGRGGREDRHRSDRDRGDRGSYRPVTGDYGRSEPDRGGSPRDRPVSSWERDEYRRTSFAGSADRDDSPDPHYHQWRQRQMEELDRDYADYRREYQAKFENDFGEWRSNRQTKRQMLAQIREHMDVVGNDEQPVGTVDRVAGDRIILTKSDEAAGGAHHSLSCSDIDRIEGERVILSSSAELARNRWRDESRERALFEREDPLSGPENRGEAGPHMLDRSFSGTYR